MTIFYGYKRQKIARQKKICYSVFYRVHKKETLMSVDFGYVSTFAESLTGMLQEGKA
jgi:hypothetical protein